VDILLDPFNAGAELTEEDCARLLREVYGRPVPLLQSFLSPISNRQFLARMLNNLKNNYLTLEEYDRAIRVEQFLMALEPENWEEVRDRGIISYRAGHRWQAVIDMQTYLKHSPKARDANLIKSQITDIIGEISKNN
jgi:regulator of sirC expression with transglutaminase-like and TPR domain